LHIHVWTCFGLALAFALGICHLLCFRSLTGPLPLSSDRALSQASAAALCRRRWHHSYPSTFTFTFTSPRLHPLHPIRAPSPSLPPSQANPNPRSTNTSAQAS
jgi:hypothetical protein